MKRVISLFFILAILLCGCEGKTSTEMSPDLIADEPVTVSSVGSFSYEQHLEQFASQEPGVIRSGFANTEKSACKDARQAILLAKKECTVEYNAIAVDYDSTAKIYLVSFYTEMCAGGNQDIYIGEDGITQLIIYGE